VAAAQVGVNGAGKTTQLQIVMGKLLPDAGEIVKAKKNMRIAYLAQVGRPLRHSRASSTAWPPAAGGGIRTGTAGLPRRVEPLPRHHAAGCRAAEPCRRARLRSPRLALQEFDVEPTRTVREEFYSVYNKQMQVVAQQEAISKELENVGEDMDRMQVGWGEGGHPRAAGRAAQRFAAAAAELGPPSLPAPPPAGRPAGAAGPAGDAARRPHPHLPPSRAWLT
jgi:hypothetical protein